MSTTAQPEGQFPPTGPILAEAVRQPPPPPPRRRSFWGRLFLAILLVAFLGSLCLNLLLVPLVALGLAGSLESDHRVQEKFFSHNREAHDKVVILSIEGGIFNPEDGFVKQQIDQVIKDESVKGVVLRINSPGGTITGSDFLYHHLVQLRQERKVPMVVSMGGIAASGGYYAAMAVGHEPDVLFAEPTTWTGSIGVVIPHYSLADLLGKVGVADDSIASHPLKTMGSFTKPMTDEERKIFQALIDDGFDRFKEVVRSGRSRFEKDPAALDRLATGQIFTAAQAKRSGLVDQIGFIEEAIDRAISLAGLDEENVKVVKYEAKPSLRSLLMGGQARSAPALDLKVLLEMTTPRAYYLCTWLPGVEGIRD
jgi:protease-4